ncbi:MAG: TIGR00296 family protein, partial [Euryarchaeota archaeon]|nr:TIGR00296 family protein [Euryarchaeota archaeon]
MYSLEDGAFLVKLARSAIEKYLNEGKLTVPPKNAPEKVKEKAGVFVTLETYPKKDLRGCIGYPEPVMPLVEATTRAAVSAAVQDPRFPPVLRGELESTL